MEECDPIFEVIDNINIYRGTAMHLRLFKSIVPKMWNFTGRYLFKPFTDGIDKTLIESQTYAIQPQKDLQQIDADDVLIGKVKFFKHLSYIKETCHFPTG